MRRSVQRVRTSSSSMNHVVHKSYHVTKECSLTSIRSHRAMQQHARFGLTAGLQNQTQSGEDMTKNSEILNEIYRIRSENKEQFERLLEEIDILTLDTRLGVRCQEHTCHFYRDTVCSATSFRSCVSCHRPLNLKRTKKECRTCKWGNQNCLVGDYRCSRYPPKRGLFDSQILPRVYPDGLCGEWCEQ